MTSFWEFACHEGNFDPEVLIDQIRGASQRSINHEGREITQSNF